MPVSSAHRGDGADLTLRLALPPEARPSARHFPLYVVFANAGGAALRLLNQFVPLPVFFSFNLIRPDETAVSLPGAGKADFPAGMLTYAVLAPGDALTVEVDLAGLLPSDAALPPGEYRVSAAYHNQYGEACFQGWRQSGALTVPVSR